jgi:hypothetical protein
MARHRRAAGPSSESAADAKGAQSAPSGNAETLAQLARPTLRHPVVMDAGPRRAPRSTGIFGAGTSFTPETFSCRTMLANRLLTNRYLGSGQTMKKSLPSHAPGSMSRDGSAITYSWSPQVEHHDSSLTPAAGAARPPQPVTTSSNTRSSQNAELLTQLARAFLRHAIGY